MDSMVDFKNISKPYFIGEIGINHNGDMQIAKKLIDAVSACGWNCAKFQKRNPDVCVPEHQKNKIRETPWGRMTYLEYKYRVEFEKEQYDIINQYCLEKPIDWTASVWDTDSLEFLLEYNVPFLKIPSAMITNIDLVSQIARTKVPIVMSTGMSTLREIDEAVNVVFKYSDNVVIMHTNSSYPTPRQELNLRLIPVLKERYGCVIGYSGHEEDLEPTVIAVTLGAEVIERHITLSHDLWGTDQRASLEVHAMNMLRKRCEDVDIILGSTEKTVTESEVPIRKKLRG
jgi:N-acetylneuraminate synthase